MDPIILCISFYGPRHYVPEKYHDYIPSKILDGCLVSNFNDMALLQSSPNMHFSTIYVQPFLNYAYSCDLNENGQMAQNEINPNVFSLLVDQCNFDDNFPPSRYAVRKDGKTY